MNAKKLRPVLLVLGGLTATPALAKLFTYDLASEFGPVNLTIDTGTGDVIGTYPKFDGKIYGKLLPANTIDGFWVQPKGDHPCQIQRHGSYSWGRLVFENPAGGHLNGSWSYCDGEPARPWKGHIR